MPDPTFPSEPAPEDALAEIAGDLAALEDAPLEALRPDVRAAALAAWTAAAATDGALAVRDVGPTPSPRVLPAAARPPLHLLRWAALLVVGIGVTLLAVLSSPEEATAGFRLGTLFRLDQSGGRQEATSGRRIPWGQRLAAQRHEVLGFRLPDGSAVVLRDAGAVRPVRAEDGSAVLALESGTARVAVGDAGEVRLAVGSCRLVLTQGRAWVSADAVLLALGPTGRGRLQRPGTEERLLEGPLEVRCTPAGDVDVRAGVADPERFRMPSVLAVDHLGRAPGRLVAARQWRIARGAGRRRGTSIQLGASGALLAWRPSPDVRRAHTLRLRIEAAEGLEVSLAGGASTTVPAGRSVDLPLPADWYPRLAASGAELVLELRWPKSGRAGARFLGATFLSDLSDDEFHAAEAAGGSPRRE